MLLPRQQSAKVGCVRPDVARQGCTGVFIPHLIKVYRNQQGLQQIGLDFWKLFSNNQEMAKQPSKHGGKRPGAGRKPLAPDERRDQVFSIKLTADEKQLLEESGARTWARAALLRVARKRIK
jgi:hypothetical protein